MRGSARYFSFSRMNLARFLIKIEEGNTRRRRKSNSVRPFKETGKRIATKGTKSTKLMIMSFVLFVPFVAILFPVLKWFSRIRFSSAPGISLVDLYKKSHKVHPTEKKVPGRAPHSRRLELERESYSRSRR